ncbi:hypothetical protein V5O48_017349 [Marasmius crinis-equi]|uniref:WD40 repeat-like protein n=1 Tax=Marasmius crinis-equi TaxID=585013 RepID=A0ABR3EP83_9AGAR
MFKCHDHNPAFSQQGKYLLRSRLRGHVGPVICIASHPLGDRIACGGENGTTIWNLYPEKLLESPTRSGERGPTTAMIWITNSDRSGDALAFGTADGFLCVWRRGGVEEDFVEVYCNRLQGREDGQEITALAFDPASRQLAVAHRAGIIHRFSIDHEMLPLIIRSIGIPRHSPQALLFYRLEGDCVPETEIWSFGREDGEIHILDPKGNIARSKTTGTIIGHVDANQDTMVLDDVSQGVALYRLPNLERVRTFLVPTTELRSRNVCFYDSGNTVLTGSDHGKVYIFNRRTGALRDVLDTGFEDWVQTIAVSKVNGRPVIVAGRSGEKVATTDIQVWERRTTGVKKSSRWYERVFLIATILFVLQNVMVRASA